MVHTVNQLPYNTNKTKLHLQLDPVDSPGSVRHMRFASCPPEGASKKKQKMPHSQKENEKESTGGVSYLCCCHLSRNYR